MQILETPISVFSFSSLTLCSTDDGLSGVMLNYRNWLLFFFSFVHCFVVNIFACLTNYAQRGLTTCVCVYTRQSPKSNMAAFGLQ